VALAATAVRACSRSGSAAPYARFMAAGLVVCLGMAGVQAVRANAVLHREDTRTRAWRWCMAHLPAGAVIAREAYCPQIPGNRFRVIVEPILGRRPLEAYRREGVAYVLTSSMVSGAFTEKTRARFPVEYEFYRGLDRSAELVQRWIDRPMGVHHPEIRLYRVRITPS
ncbi:MAG: hypothetical protein AAB368_01020, partial [bacterium]